MDKLVQCVYTGNPVVAQGSHELEIAYIADLPRSELKIRTGDATERSNVTP